MIRSGTKRGLAASAVAALAVVGIPAMAHAAGAPTSITATAGSASASTWQNDDIAIKSLAGTTTPASGDVTVTVTETFATAAAKPGTDPIIIDPTVVADAADGPGTDTTWVETGTATLGADGTINLPIASSAAGTVAVRIVAGSVAANTSFTVGGGLSGANNVKTLAVTPTTITGYTTGTAATSDPASVEVTPEDANGFGVAADAGTDLISYTVDGGATATTVAMKDPSAAADAPYTVPVDLTGVGAGTHTIKFWVNQTNGASNTPGADAGEPTATVTVTLTTAPTAVPVVPTGNDNGGIVYTGATDTAGDAVLPAGEAGSVPLSVTLVNNTTDKKPVAGVQLGFDVTLPGGQPVRYQATTDATGKASVTVPVTAAQAVAGNVTADVFESGSATAGVGKDLTDDGGVVASFAQRQPAISLAGNPTTPLQATAKGSVSINALVADQFGKVSAGDILQFEITGTGVNNNTASPALVTADANGNATFTYTDKGQPGSDTIAITDLSKPGTTEKDVTVDYVTSVTPATVTLAGPGADTQTVSATPHDDYTATVKAADGTSLRNVPVTFSVDNGFVGKPGQTSVTVNTDVNGTATVSAGSEKVGTQVVTATAGTAAAATTGNKTTYNAGAAYGISLTGDTDLTTGDTGKYVATVTDAFGNPLVGEDVDFSQAGVGGFTSGTSSLPPVVTAADGTASVTVQALSTPGSGSVTATDDDWVTRAYPNPADPAFQGATASAATAPGATVTYTVSATPPPPPPHVVVTFKPGIKLANKGKSDKITITIPAKAKGVKVTLMRKIPGKGGFKKVGAVKKDNTGSVVYTLKDQNGNKKTSYYAKTAAIKTAAKTVKAEKTPTKSIK